MLLLASGCVTLNVNVIIELLFCYLWTVTNTGSLMGSETIQSDGTCRAPSIVADTYMLHAVSLWLWLLLDRVWPVCRWSGSHIRWGQPFRLRHVTTGKYLSLMEDKSLLLTDKEKADVKSAAFTFRSSKVSQWPTTFPSDAGEWEKKNRL